MKQLIFMATLLLSLNLHAETRIQACIKACDAQYNPTLKTLNEETARIFQVISSQNLSENEQAALRSRHYWIANKTSVLQSQKVSCLDSCY